MRRLLPLVLGLVLFSCSGPPTERGEGPGQEAGVLAGFPTFEEFLGKYPEWSHEEAWDRYRGLREAWVKSRLEEERALRDLEREEERKNSAKDGRERTERGLDVIVWVMGGAALVSLGLSIFLRDVSNRAVFAFGAVSATAFTIRYFVMGWLARVEGVVLGSALVSIVGLGLLVLAIGAAVVPPLIAARRRAQRKAVEDAPL